MTPTPRRLTIQLASLLDLMLIVIFAQYVEMWETEAARDKQRASEAVRDREALATESARSRSELSSEREALDRDRASFAAQQDETQQREEELRGALDHAIDQQRQIGDIVSELYQVPDDLVQQLIPQQSSDAGDRSDAENENLKKAFRELAALRGVNAVKHLLTYQELRKRCDIWEIYITAEGVAVFDAGTASKQFRYRDAMSLDAGSRTRSQIRAEDEAAAERFAQQLFDFYKTLPQSKSVVILLLSYSKTTSYNWRRPAILGLAKAADRMRTDSDGRSRFEYALIGPVDAPAAPISTQ